MVEPLRQHDPEVDEANDGKTQPQTFSFKAKLGMDISGRRGLAIIGTQGGLLPPLESPGRVITSPFESREWFLPPPESLGRALN